MTVQFTPGAEPIPGYRLIEPLGRGGFGEVWKAEAPGGLLKAIKLVHGTLLSGHGDEALIQQELKSLDCVKKVRHPYLLSLDRYELIDGQLVVVMELADCNLWERFIEEKEKNGVGIPRETLLGYMEEAAEALDLMNIKYNLQHSDIKPHNLFLVHNHIKVADFGLVKDLKGMKALASGCFSPLYSAPETFEGWVSKNSDQYSLAIMYQELLIGRRPFNGTNARQMMMQHVASPPDLTGLSLADRGPIARALAKKPAERFDTCSDLVSALRSKPARVFRIDRVDAAQVKVPPGPVPSLLPALGPNDPGIPIECLGCGYSGKVPEAFQGKPVKCRRCGKSFRVESSGNSGILAKSAKPEHQQPMTPRPNQTITKPSNLQQRPPAASPTPPPGSIPRPTQVPPSKSAVPPVAAVPNSSPVIPQPTAAPAQPASKSSAALTRPQVPATPTPPAAKSSPALPRPQVPAPPAPAPSKSSAALTRPLIPAASVPAAPSKPSSVSLPRPVTPAQPATAVTEPPPSVTLDLRCPVCGSNAHSQQQDKLRCKQCGCVFR